MVAVGELAVTKVATLVIKWTGTASSSGTDQAPLSARPPGQKHPNHRTLGLCPPLLQSGIGAAARGRIVSLMLRGLDCLALNFVNAHSGTSSTSRNWCPSPRPSRGPTQTCSPIYQLSRHQWCDGKYLSGYNRHCLGAGRNEMKPAIGPPVFKRPSRWAEVPELR